MGHEESKAIDFPQMPGECSPPCLLPTNLPSYQTQSKMLIPKSKLLKLLLNVEVRGPDCPYTLTLSAEVHAALNVHKRLSKSRVPFWSMSFIKMEFLKKTCKMATFLSLGQLSF